MKILQYTIAIIIAQLLLVSTIKAQLVGINTTKPLQLLHIDGLSNTTSTTTDTDVEAADDVVISSSGRVGIGLINPTTKLHIDSRDKTNPSLAVSGFRLQDGSENPNYALTSDAYGFAYWAPVDFSGYTVIPYKRIRADFTAASSLGSSFIYSNLYIDFPSPGRYLISIGAKVETNRSGMFQAIFGMLRPSSNVTDPARYDGAYPVLVSNPSTTEARIVLCQEVEITAGALRAYFILEYFNTSYTGSGEIYTSWGNGGVPPEAHRTGGSYVRIN